MSADRVLIVGAGPVGLIAATHLTDAGIPVLVIESHHELPMDLRASTFHPPTLTCWTVMASPIHASSKG